MTKQLKAYFDGQKDTLKAIKLKVKGLIKFHENRIEEIIRELGFLEWDTWDTFRFIIEIEREYESLMAIEKEFEDVM